ncbi:MAG: OPT/YSL family transporter, partial [Verrucomicrobiota bacterium]
MALPTLSDEQVRTLSRSQKDQWWLDHVFRGDMPQLTVRSALTGFLLGGALAATSLYIGAKTGISIGVGLTSVLITFALFRLLARTPLGGGFTILENNCTQSITTAAGYVVTPLISSFAAYMLVTGKILPAWQMILWMIVISVLGVLVAFPLKRRFINDDQLPFPEGRACGVVLDALYTGSAEAGMFKTRLLAVTSVATAFLQWLMSDGWMRLLQFKLLRLDRWAGLREAWHLHERIDTYYYTWAAKASGAIPRILGTDIRQLGLRVTLDGALLGVGGLIGIRVASSCLLGAIVNFAVLAPVMIQRGEIRSYTNAAGKVVEISRAEIVNQWSLWWGVSMMVVGSLVSLLARPDLFKGLWRMVRPGIAPKAAAGPDPLRHLELP